ncbi:MAG: DsrE family protein [Clostridia bacterium]|nr:DsrE family protein [Clostridia bacterium]
MKEYLEGNQLEKLAVLWTSPDREVALKMAFMYTRNSERYGWWDVVRLLVWGPSAKLLSEDEELQAYVREMLENNIEVIACKACADMYGVGEKLSSLGVEVVYIGESFTQMLKSDWKVITI